MTAGLRLQVAAFGCLAALPLGMAIANRSAPAIVVVAALLSLVGRGVSGEVGEVWLRLRHGLLSPLGLAALAFLSVAAASLVWSHAPRISSRMLGELLLPLGAAVLLHASLPRLVPRPIAVAAAVAVGFGCLWALGELATGVSTRAALGFRSQDYIFKRSVTAILVVAWPIATLAWLSGRRWVPAILAALLLAAIVAAHAGAALLGLLAGAALGALALWRRRLAEGALALLLLGSLALAPIFGETADRILPARVVAALHSVQMRDRIDIWTSFGEVAKRRPFLGAGFGTSGVMDRNPVAAEVPPEHRTMLAVGHPHHGFLQIWAELGLAGAIPAAAILVLLVLAIRHRPKAMAIAATASLGSASAIMLVGHGAWQGWWAASLGAAAVWLLRIPVYSGGMAPRKPVAKT